MADSRDEPEVVESAHVAGLLADATRLRVLAALVLGHTRSEEIRAVTGLAARPVGSALARLVKGGIVVRAGDRYRAAEGEMAWIFRRLAEWAAAQESSDGDSALRAFFKGGRLVNIPVAKSKRRVVLDHIVQEFEPGVRYKEPIVNEVLKRYHDDYAALRRYLVDEGFLKRARGVYWRAGGTFDVG